MTNFERVNAPRVERIRTIVHVIARSAKSNDATAQEVETLLRPAMIAMSDLCPSEEQLEFDYAAGITPEPSEDEVYPLQYHEVPKLVAEIPENLITSVLTQLMARVCNQVEDKKEG